MVRLQPRTIYTRPLRLKWQADPAWRKPTGQRSRRSITATATSEPCNVAMTVEVVGSSSRVRIFDSFVQIGHSPLFATEIEGSPTAITRSFINPAAPPHHPKEVTLGNHVRRTTDCPGQLVLAQTASSTEEPCVAECRHCSGQGVVSHDHDRASGTRSATVVELIRNTNRTRSNTVET
jgi:hypothetical protein